MSCVEGRGVDSLQSRESWNSNSSCQEWWQVSFTHWAIMLAWWVLFYLFSPQDFFCFCFFMIVMHFPHWNAGGFCLFVLFFSYTLYPNCSFPTLLPSLLQPLSFLIFFYVYECFAYVYVCATCMPSTRKGWEKESDSLGLKWVLGMKSKASERAVGFLNCWAISRESTCILVISLFLQ